MTLFRCVRACEVACIPEKHRSLRSTGQPVKQAEKEEDSAGFSEDLLATDWICSNKHILVINVHVHLLWYGFAGGEG